MDTTSRWLLLLLVIGYTLFRLVRYMRFGLAKRPAPAVPASAGIILQSTPTENTAAPPLPAGNGNRAVRLAGMLVALGVWCAGNVLVWASLFGVAALSEVPVLWRLVTGVLANFYLIHLAREAAAKTRNRLTA